MFLYQWAFDSALKCKVPVLDLDVSTKEIRHLCQENLENLEQSVFQLYSFLYCFLLLFYAHRLVSKYFVLMRFIVCFSFLHLFFRN